MLTVIGTAAVCLSAIGLGTSYASSLRHERDVLLALLSLCQRISTRIECFRQPLPDIYRDLEDGRLDPQFLSDLKESGLSYALVKNKRRLCLSHEIYGELCAFASELGKSYADGQIRLCRECTLRLKNASEELEGRLPSRVRLSLTLSAAGAAMAAILFL
jgi:hypothetical protein